MSNRLLLIPAGLLLLALLPLPYGYYTLLRLVITLSAAIVAWDAFSTSGRIDGQVALFSLVALLFNPVFPVHLTREIWFFINIVVAAVFAVRALKRDTSGAHERGHS